MAKSTKTPVTLIQNPGGQAIAVRVGDGGPIAVGHAGPVPGPGQMNLVMQINDVDISFEAAATEDTKA